MSQSVLPMHQRPICEWCGRRLRPHYRTETADGPTKWRKLRPDEMRNSADPHDETAQPKDEVYFFDGANDTYHGPEYRRGCWRVPAASSSAATATPISSATPGMRQLGPS
jgi:hypothetical protein